MIFIATYVTVLMAIGHLVFGISWYVKPVLTSEIDAATKTVMHAIYHYISVFIIISAAVLFIYAYHLLNISPEVIFFIGLCFTLFGLINMILVFISKSPVSKKKVIVNPTLYIAVGILSILSSQIIM